MANKQSSTAQAKSSTKTKPTAVPETSTQAPETAAPEATLAETTSMMGIPASPSTQGVRQKAVLGLQRKRGNQYVQRYIDRHQPQATIIQRHASTQLQYPEDSIQAKHIDGFVQRHASTQLQYPEDSIQAKLAGMPDIQRASQKNLADKIREAMGSWGTDSQAIKDAVVAASADERREVLNDPQLMAQLKSKLSRGDALIVLEGLGAPLAQRLKAAMDGWGCDSAEILKMVSKVGVPVTEKQAVLRDSALMARLRDELSRKDAIQALTDLGASLAERIYAAMEGWGVDAQAIKDLTKNASDPDKLAALHDRTLIDRIKGELSRADMLTVLANLKASIADRLNAAMDGWGADSATILEITKNATAPEQTVALSDTALLNRLKGELSRADMLTVLANLKAPLVNRLNVAMDGWGADKTAVLDMIPKAATDAERLAAHDDPVFIARIKSEFSEEVYWQIRLLLFYGTQAKVDAKSTIVPAVSNGVYYQVNALIKETENAKALPIMVNYLVAQGALDTSQYTSLTYDASGAGEALTSASFKKDTSTNTWKVSAPPKVTIHPVAFNDVGWLYSSIMHEYQHVLQYNGGYNRPPGSADLAEAREVEAYLWEIEHATDSGVNTNAAQLTDLGSRLTTHYNALPALRQAPYTARYNAALALVAAPAAGPAATPDSLTAKVSASLQKTPPDTGQILADLATAPQPERDIIKGNMDLMSRLEAVMSAADMRQALTALGVGIVDQLDLLIRQKATTADIVTLIKAATPADRTLVLDNRGLIDRLLAYVPATDQEQVLDALQDSLLNRINRMAATKPVDTAALATAVKAAAQPARDAVINDSVTMENLRSKLTALEFWKAQLLLTYGNEAAYPTGVTTLLATLGGTPTFDTIKLTLVNMSTPDFDALKVVIGLKDVLKSFVTDDKNYMTVLRILDQGYLDEETNINAPWPETLQVADPTTGVFAGQVFSGTSGFDVTYMRDHFQVEVRIKLNPTDAQAKTDMAATKALWEPMIENAWDNQYRLRNAQHTIPIRVNCYFTDSSPHHTVNVSSQVNPSWPAYNMTNWYYRAANYAATSPIHEVGHMLGSKDEYSLSAADYQATVGQNPVTDPNAVATADTAGNNSYANSASVMGSNSAARPDPRHFNFFVNWINNHRRKDSTGAFVDGAFVVV